MTKYVKDMQHASMVNAWVLTDQKGIFKGRMIANWTNSGTCYFMVYMYLQDKGFESAQDKASGYGYDKLGAAAGKAFQRLGFKDELLRNARNGAGFSEIELFIENLNLKLYKAC